MTGVKQFDPDAIIERAMLHFWRVGYGAASIQDLEKATKLRRGSLYNAFGDKEALFIAALKHYDITVGAKRIEQLSNPDPYRAIGGFLDTLVEQLGMPGRPRGCLHVNTSLEIPTVPKSILRIIASRSNSLEDAFYSVFREGRKQGSIARSVDIRAMARFYLGVAKGIAVLHKVNGDKATLRDVVAVAMTKWPAADMPD